jgi:hypothetical protein
MNLSEMDKEKKQLLILAVGGCITVVMVISNLLIGPARADAATATETIAELENEVSSGERILRRAVMTERDVRNFSSEILAIHRDELPPSTSPYIWAVENLSLLAEELNLTISVKEHPAARYVPVSPTLSDVNPESVPMWIPYSVDVEFNASFAKLKNFVDVLEESLKFAAVVGLRVESNPSNPEEHDISLILEWPTFRFEEDLAWIQEQAGEEKTP